MREGCRAYLLAVGAGVCAFFMDGALKAMGVMMLDIQEDFSSKTWIIGSIASLMNGIGCLFGMLTEPMCRYVHPRWVVVICGCLTFVGYVVSSQASQLAVFAPFLILFCGIGQEISNIVTIGTLVEHFEENYGLAISIANAGTCLAIVVIPPLTQYIKDVFGWRGALLIIGGMSFHIVPCGLLIPPGKSAMVADQEERAEYTPINDEKKRVKGRAEYTPINMVNDEEERVNGSSFLNVVRHVISTTHLYLFLDVQFTAHIIGWFAGNYSTVGWIIFLIPCMEKKGISAHKAVYLSAIGGVSSLLSRFVGAYLLDRKIIPNVFIFQVVSFAINGSLLVSHAFTDSYGVMVWITIIYGISGGFVWIALYYQVKHIVPIDKVIPALAWCSMAASISGSLVGLLSGRLDERFGNLDVAFIVLGAPMILAAGLYILSVCCRPKQNNAIY